MHLNTQPEDIPAYAKDVGTHFMNVLAIVNPLNLEDLKESLAYKRSYMYVRNNREKLDAWIGENYDKIASNPTKFKNTFVHYWLENSGEGDGGFKKEDISFEVFHNYLALSQWGNTIYNMMALLRSDNNDAQAKSVQSYFKEMMSGNYQATDGTSTFTRLDLFTFELLRIIMPNDGSISSVKIPPNKLHGELNMLNIHDHVSIANSPLHWPDAVEHSRNGSSVWVAPFNPERYKNVPTSSQIDCEDLKKTVGLARCPFEHDAITTKDGRTIENNAFGTIYSRNGEEEYPVIETAGYSPFGFGYRRCPGELFTINVFKSFLTHVWENNISFEKLDITSPAQIPVAPGTFVADNIGFFVK